MTAAATASSAGGPARETGEALELAVTRLSETQAPAYVVDGLRALRGEIGQPCVVAVVGQVNAGKSTFINALLKEDMAVVGSTETTATINHFVFGNPDPSRPVRCHWRGGTFTEESSEFLASLQGNDLATLKRAEGIDRLEYLVPNPLLASIKLVDTPGRGAVVREHEARTEVFLDLQRRLRERHDAETQNIHESADAIVYLVGAVARASDQELLEQFSAASGGSGPAMNALGVIAKVDLSPEMLSRRHDLASKIRGQLGDQLNDVVPVSAALSRALDRLDGEGRLGRLIHTVRQIPEAQLSMLLQNQELFCEYDPPEGCPVPAALRRELWLEAACAWRVFATIVVEGRREASVGEVTATLRDLAGFDRLHRTLEDHFLQRGEILRCHRIARDAREILKRFWFEDLLGRRRNARADRTRLDRFLGFIEGAGGDPEIAHELSGFVSAQLDGSEQTSRLQEAWKGIDGELARLERRLGEYNADFAALTDLAAAPSAFTKEETELLRSLLGMYGTDTSRRLDGDVDIGRCVEEQLRWRLVHERTPRGSARSGVSARAYARLGLILEELDPP